MKDLAPVSQVKRVAEYPGGAQRGASEDCRGADEPLPRHDQADLTFASSGSGSAPHMAAELFRSAAGLDMRHIPYKGGGAAIPDLLGGRITMMFGAIVVALPVVREGKLRALAVTSWLRSSAAPGVPTIAESGFPGFEYVLWAGLFAPARTPAAIVHKLHRGNCESARSIRPAGPTSRSRAGRNR